MWEHILSFTLITDFSKICLVCPLFRHLLYQDSYWQRKEKKSFSQVRQDFVKDKPIRLLIKNLAADIDLFTLSCFSMNRRKIFLDLRKFLYRYFAGEKYFTILQRVENTLHENKAKEFTLSIQVKHVKKKTYFRLFLSSRTTENTILERQLINNKQLHSFFSSCREIKKSGIKSMTCSGFALDLFLN